MKKLAACRRAFEQLLETITILLMVSLAAVVIVAVIYRWSGVALVWYDEVASIQLAWLTYYASALAALKGAHIGVPGLVAATRPPIRLCLVLIAKAITIGFFLVLAWYGYLVVQVLEGDALISLPEISTQITQSVIPIGALLFIAAELLNLPFVLCEALRGEPPAAQV